VKIRQIRVIRGLCILRTLTTDDADLADSHGLLFGVTTKEVPLRFRSSRRKHHAEIRIQILRPSMSSVSNWICLASLPYCAIKHRVGIVG